MNEKQLDVRGLACPQPVVMTRNALLESHVDRVHVLLSSDVSAENVQRLAQSQGWTSQIARQNDEIQLTLTRGSDAAAPGANPQATSEVRADQAEVVVFITSNLFGEGDEKLGQILMKAFIKTLKDLDPLPTKVIFANSGVRLTCEGSDLIETLQELERVGLEVLSCGTCLDFYQLIDSLQVGAASNMYEIVSALVAADRIVKP